MSSATHIPVMLNEVLDALDVRPGGRYVDCTLGGAGHAEAILDRAQPGGTLLGIDADAAAIERAKTRLAPFEGSVKYAQGNFRDVGDICRQLEFAPVNGVLMDLGLSSYQLAEGDGFSFRSDTPLDMRFGGDGITAEEARQQQPARSRRVGSRGWQSPRRNSGGASGRTCGAQGFQCLFRCSKLLRWR